MTFQMRVFCRSALVALLLVLLLALAACGGSAQAGQSSNMTAGHSSTMSQPQKTSKSDSGQMQHSTAMPTSVDGDDQEIQSMLKSLDGTQDDGSMSGSDNANDDAK